MVLTLGSDQDFKQDLLEDIKTARERDKKIVELASQSFNVVLGAILGFLSAIGAGRLAVGRVSDKSPNDRGTIELPPADDAPGTANHSKGTEPPSIAENTDQGASFNDPRDQPRGGR